MSEPDKADGRLLRALLVEDSRLDAELLRVRLGKSYPNVRLEVVRDEASFLEALAGGGWEVSIPSLEDIFVALVRKPIAY